MTFDASHKVTKQGGHHLRFISHIGRDVDLANGVVLEHSNTGIVPERTSHNVTMVNDGKGGYARPRSTNALLDAVDVCLARYQGKAMKDGKPKPLQKNAVIMRPFILQLDPDWFDDNCPDWRETGDIGDEGRRFVSESLAWCEGEFGQANIAFTSLHLDEYSPQLQVAFVPMTSDGRLSQKEFFKGPQDFRRQHTELREHMAAAGYDVTMEKVTKDRTIKAMGTVEYKQYRETLDSASTKLAEAQEKLDAADHRAMALDDRESSLEARSASVSAGEAQLVDKTAALAQRAADVDQKSLVNKKAYLALVKDQELLTEQLEEQSAAVHRAEGFAAYLEEMTPDFEVYLDIPLQSGKTMRSNYDQVMSQHKAKRAGDLESVGKPAISMEERINAMHERDAADTEAREEDRGGMEL